VVVAKGDDIAYTQGVYTMTYSEPKTGMTLIEKGKYVTVYKKQDDGTWKAVEDIDNADAPATQAPAETPAAKT
jgi:ketosteroid isomerase-like protein